MNTTTEPRDAILSILEEERRLYQRLLSVSDAKREALLAADSTALAPLVREMEGIIRTVEGLEDDRMAKVALLTGGEAGAVTTLSGLTAFYASADLERLHELRGALLDAIQRLRLLNNTNAALVHQALIFADQWSRLLRAASPATYAANGALSGGETVTKAWVA